MELQKPRDDAATRERSSSQTPTHPRPTRTPSRQGSPSPRRQSPHYGPIVSPLADFDEKEHDLPYVFLGGSCDPTTWRRDIAIPILQRSKVPFYNPQIADWNPSLIDVEAQAKELCHCLLFVIDSQTRAIASMLEATEYILSHRKVVLVIEDMPEGIQVDGEVVGQRQLEDLNRARAFLCDIAARHQKNCDIFPSVDQAVRHIAYSYGKHKRAAAALGVGGMGMVSRERSRSGGSRPELASSQSASVSSGPPAATTSPAHPAIPILPMGAKISPMFSASSLSPQLPHTPVSDGQTVAAPVACASSPEVCVRTARDS